VQFACPHAHLSRTGYEADIRVSLSMASRGVDRSSISLSTHRFPVCPSGGSVRLRVTAPDKRRGLIMVPIGVTRSPGKPFWTRGKAVRRWE
jgi:hypothetical protein